LVKVFHGGAFITLYLSPRDYHRIHMPLGGKILRMTYVPGRLFAVNQASAQVIPNLFARNERVINLFETPAGPMALIMVGAIFVGGMETVRAGPITPIGIQGPLGWTYGDNAVSLQKGDEMGRFNMGSTVILLFGPDVVRWQPGLQAGMGVRMGQQIGNLNDGR
jgi:phosphatidylserine decarboxylase